MTGPIARELRREEHHGVPVLTRAAVGDAVLAGVCFPVGQGHEPPRLRGITHLVEHLAHDGLGDVEYEFNASVGVDETVFWARGDAEDVRRHLEHVLTRLAAPPLEAMEREAGVLRAEGGGGQPASVTERFVPVGVGGLGWREFFLDDARPEELAAWAAARFGRAGAVACSLGAWPDPALDVLGPGALHAAPVARPRPGPAPPGWVDGRTGGVGWSGACAVGWAGTTATEVLLSRTRRRLRDELGATYALQDGVVPAGDRRIRWIEADHDHQADPRVVRDVLIGELARLAEEPPTPEEVGRMPRDVRRHLGDAQDQTGGMLWMASLAVRGTHVGSFGELLAEIAATEPDAVSHAAGEMYETRVLQTAAAAAPADLPSLVPAASPAFDAPTFVPSRVARGLVPQPTDAFFVDPAIGVGRRGEDGATLTVRFADAVLAVVEDEIAVWIYDDAGREILVELDDADDRARWLAPIERALGPERIARRSTGRRELRAAVEQRAAADLGQPARFERAGLALDTVVERHESVLRLAAGRHDGDETLIAVTDMRLVLGKVDRVDGVWFGLSDLEVLEVADGFRGGRLVFGTRDGGRFVVDRVKPKGRAAELAELLRREGRPTEPEPDPSRP